MTRIPLSRDNQILGSRRPDASCRTSMAKVGKDNDQKTSGCEAIRFTIPKSGQIASEYVRI
jgi:hypothetical protein